MHWSYLLLLSVVLVVGPAQGLTKEEYSKKLKDATVKCLSGLKISKEDLAALFQNASEFDRDVKCAIFCIDKHLFEISSYGPQFNEELISHFKVLFKDDPEKLQKTLGMMEICKDKIAPDNCDTAAEQFFCYREEMKKRGLLLTHFE